MRDCLCADLIEVGPGVLKGFETKRCIYSQSAMYALSRFWLEMAVDYEITVTLLRLGGLSMRFKSVPGRNHFSLENDHSLC